MPDESTSTQLSIRFSDRQKQRLNEIAFELSEPGERVNASDVVREAVRDYLEKFDEAPEQCDPRKRGCIGEVEEGAA